MSLPFVPRDEDHRLLTGAGRFLDDERAEGEAMASSCARRTPLPRSARSTRSGAGHARRARGADRRRHGAAGIGNRDACRAGAGRRGMVGAARARRSPATCVRHVGDAVALVVAETEAAARDAAELVAVDYEPRDAVTDSPRGAAGRAAALARGAGQCRARLARLRPTGDGAARARPDLCRRRACRAGAARQPAHRHGADGAARRARRIRSREPTATCSTAPRRAPLSCASISRACLGVRGRAGAGPRAAMSAAPSACAPRIYPEYPALLLAAKQTRPAGALARDPARRASSATTRRAIR